MTAGIGARRSGFRPAQSPLGCLDGQLQQILSPLQGASKRLWPWFILLGVAECIFLEELLGEKKNGEFTYNFEQDLGA